MAKTHTYSGFNGWQYYLVSCTFFDSWYSKVIEIKLMNYFSLVSKNSKLERNEPFSAEIILYFIRNKGNYLTCLEFSQVRRRSIQKEICEAYTFHIQWQCRFCCPKWCFRIVSFYAVSNAFRRKKTAFKRRFSFQPITRH